MKLYFWNRGFFNLRAMLTFGFHAKPKHKDNSIGQFGTGFKYAVAIILRHGGTISVDTWENGAQQTYRFHTEAETVRGETINIVKVNGQDAGFTTHMGINWEPWMAFRELYSNMLDEDGDLGPVPPQDAQTIITVESVQVWEAYQSKSDYFLHSNPLHINDEIGAEIHPGPGKYYYYRGIAVLPTGERKTAYIYNITRGVELSEERTARYSFQLLDRAKQVLQTCDDGEITDVIAGQYDLAEEEFDFSEHVEPSRAFYQSCKAVEERPVGGRYEKRNSSVARILQVQRETKFEHEPWVATTEQAAAFGHAIRFLMHIDVDFDGVDWQIVQGMDDDGMGMARVRFPDWGPPTVYVDQCLFSKGHYVTLRHFMACWLQINVGKIKPAVTDKEWLIQKVISMAGGQSAPTVGPV